MPTKTKQIHPDIPTDRAWQTGRRIYIRCGYKTKLNDGLRQLGAHWDAEERALWIGSTKKAEVVDLVLIAEARRDQIDEIKAAGRWVHIPYEATLVRDRAKELGGKWDQPTKAWAMPTDEVFAEVHELAAIWRQQAAAKREQEAKARKEADRLAREEWRREEKRRKAVEAARLREQAIANSGRISTGETAELREISTRRMNKATALAAARRIGEVIRLKDGRRGLVTGVEVWFTGEEMASSVCWHPETHDEAHWDFKYELLIVEPTAEETAADLAAAAEREDAKQIHELMRQADTLTGATHDDRWSPIPPETIAGTITVTTGITAVINAGRLVLTTDGRVVWQHPGFYDDYIRSEGISQDPELAARVRVLLDGGPRGRVVPGQMPTYYKITVGDG